MDDLKYHILIHLCRQVLHTVRLNPPSQNIEEMVELLGTNPLSNWHIDAGAQWILAQELPSPRKHHFVPSVFAHIMFSRKFPDIQEELSIEVSKGNIDDLWFPYVHQGSWVVMHADLDACNLSFIGTRGVSIPKRDVQALQTWLQKCTPGITYALEPTLGFARPVVTDDHSCGPAILDTLAHAILGRPMWDQAEWKVSRMGWFLQLWSSRME